MRATYEDVLRAARRAAVQAHGIPHTDKELLLSGWQSVLAATRTHLSWLRSDLDLGEGSGTPQAAPDAVGGLLSVAQAIGAGADLLAAQDAFNAVALENHAALAAARAEVAEIVQVAGRIVLRDLGPRTRNTKYLRVLAVMRQLEHVAQAGRGSGGLGALRNLTTVRPRHGTDDLSRLASMVVRWERAHLDVEPRTLLTRDLRSGTSQLRTISGYAGHLADCIASAAQCVDGGGRVPIDLRRLKEALRAFDTSAARVARLWQRRLSDVGGQSEMLGEVAFLDLKAAFDAFIHADGDLVSPRILIPDRRRAIEALDTLDELIDAAARVARFQQDAVDDLIRSGYLFMPVRDIGSMDLPDYSRQVARPAVRSRWMRTSIAMYFNELTGTLAQSSVYLSIAADIARGLSGTTYHRRPVVDRYPRIVPPPLRASLSLVAGSTGFSDQGQEPGGPSR